MRRASWGRAGALTLTVLVHLLLLIGAGKQGSAPKPLPQPAPVALMVTLLPEQTAARAAPAIVAEPVLPLPVAPPSDRDPEPEPRPEPPVMPQHVEAPLQFFQLHELTSPPKVASGLARGQWLELPGTSGGFVTVRFWINALGEVVRVQVVEVDGNEDDEEKLLAALHQVRFLPARVGHDAVPSELQLEVRVVRSAGL